ncbi:MAG: hypothetical protein ACLQUT_01655 [Thermoleophilia bacterium]
MKATTTTTHETTLTGQLMREAIDQAMSLVAEMQECLGDYDAMREAGEPVSEENVSWMHQRVLDLERAAEGFRAYTLE